MQVEYVGRKVDVTEQIRDLTEKKLSKVLKYFNDVLDIQVEIDQERHLYVVEVFVQGKDFDARATAQSKDVNSAIQDAVDKLEIQARRAKTRLKDRKKKGNGGARSVPGWNVDVLERESVAPGGTPRIVKTNTIQIKPMTIDEAALQLEKSRNEFIVFLNASSDRVNVLYRRRDNNLGLITPEL